MTVAAASEIVRNLSREQAISLWIIVEEKRSGDFATACGRVLGANWRAVVAAVAGAPMSDAEFRAAVYAHVAG